MKYVWVEVKGRTFDDLYDDMHSINLIRRQYSGNVHGLIKGIGMVNCLYVNPESGQFYILGYRIYDLAGDSKTKLDHAREMLLSLVGAKSVRFTHVLFDSWYATKILMLLIKSFGKIYYCPLKSNRKVDDSGGVLSYQAVEHLKWNAWEEEHGKFIKIHGFPKEHKVNLFRVVVLESRTDWVVTNNHAQNSTQAAREVYALRWKIEQSHREIKQLTGIEKCQCRKARIQRNHIACAVLVWIRLTQIARKTMTTVYQIKENLLSGYLRKELRSLRVSMGTA